MIDASTTQGLARETDASPGTHLYATVLRRDRAVHDEAWIRQALRVAPFGFLATVNDGVPFINGNLFVFDEEAHCIYMHTARRGRTRTNVSASESTNDAVCFMIAEMGRLLPADRAKEFSVEYAGVVVFGRGSIITDPVKSERALQRLLDKYFGHLQPGRDYAGITPVELRQTTTYEIAIDQWSGKRKIAPVEVDGAFSYATSLLER
jgi:nitroimidazol reductase NimA-like FMN-containing flavoprotein (pyridoxamine 5'-phosphate oxidase superfamily)